MKRMKSIMMMLVCLLATNAMSAQTLNSKDQKAIDAKVKTFLGFMESKDYTKTLDLIYPKFFEHSPKNDLFQVFDLLEKSGIELKFNDLEVIDTQAMGTEAKVDYALIKYRLNMELPLTTDELKGYAAFMVPMLQGNFGKENVDYNRKESYIKVTGERFLMGVNDPAHKDWLFLLFDKSFKTELAKTLPASVNNKAAAIAF